MATKAAPQIPGLNMEALKLSGFKVHELTTTTETPAVRGRRDFYKMGLITGDMTIEYGGKIVKIEDNVLFFVNPDIPHSIIRRNKKTTGYACLFTETFFAGRERNGILNNSPLFQIGDSPVIPLNSEQTAFITSIFQKMLAIYKSEYLFKGELVRTCIELIIHEALRIQPSEHAPQFVNAASRIVHLFKDLLERQFPIEQKSESLKLRTPQDFALALSIHVNYLNRAVKEVTGKPTSAHIAERISAEAKALLQYTDWSIADIAYALGFQYPTYFNNYFKRVTGLVPNSIRK